MKRFSLQNRVSKFMPKKFYEIDPWPYFSYKCHFCNYGWLALQSLKLWQSCHRLIRGSSVVHFILVFLKLLSDKLERLLITKDHSLKVCGVAVCKFLPATNIIILLNYPNLRKRLYTIRARKYLFKMPSLFNNHFRYRL
jgi:hypothetical protein